MTAEIVIMNSSAAALAADSTVSIGSSKEYKSASKLFQLLSCQPVGIMIYGNASFMGVPWELIIKEYRSTRGNSFCLETVNDYALDFLRFVASTDSIFPDGYEVRSVKTEVASYIRYVRDRDYSPLIEDYITNNGIIDEDVALEKLSEVFIKQRDYLLQCSELDCVGDEYLSNLENMLSDVFPEIITEVFAGPLSDELSTVVKQIAYLVLSKDIRNGPSGLVIVGFGQSEMFPAMQEFCPQFRINDCLSYFRVPNRESKIDPYSNPAIVAPCAQRNPVDAFIGGIDMEFFGVIGETLTETLKTFAQTTAARAHDVAYRMSKKNYESLLEESLEEARVKSEVFIEAINKRSSDYYSQPILQAVSILPKDELAAMAESLVNLNSLRQRVSLERETVGGPIDVAVISKGDGFVWINRKHYFPAELNPRYFLRNEQH